MREMGVPSFAALLLAAFMVLAPALAAAHDLEHLYEQEEDDDHAECVLCEFGDRTDDVAVSAWIGQEPPSFGLILPSNTPSASAAVDLPAAGIRGPPLTL
ncbi:MAG: hypothetical protein AAGH41_04730 [Pseudomonadota bacterium]